MHRLGHGRRGCVRTGRGGRQPAREVCGQAEQPLEGCRGILTHEMASSSFLDYEVARDVQYFQTMEGKGAINRLQELQLERSPGLRLVLQI